jgi:hypothetical protein
MSEWETEDPNAAAWEELRATDQAAYDFAMAQAAAADLHKNQQQQLDEQRVAQNVANMMEQAKAANEYAAIHVHAAEVADRSMLAHYGEAYERTRQEIARSIVADAEADPAHAYHVNFTDPRELTDHLEAKFLDLEPKTRPGASEWNRIKKQGDGSVKYWQDDVFKSVQPKGPNG